MYFPQSIFGVLTASNWRWLEHAGWVVFIDIFLIISCLRGKSEMQELAEKTTDLETAERKSALKIGEERYRELFENANDLIFTHDLTGNITSVNKMSEIITGYLRDEAVKMNVNQVIAPDYIEYALRMTTRMVEKKMPVSYEMLILTKDGANVWLEANTRLIYENGKPFGVQGIARDITERKRIDEELARTRDAALESARLKSEFLANMSHEIRTPMNSIIGLTGLLLESGLPAEQHDLVETVTHSAEALLTIINDILDFSKIEAGKLELEIIDFDLRRTVSDIRNLFTEQSLKGNNRLVFEIAPEVSGILRGDPGRLRQILTNLVGNAVKFTKNGSVSTTVEVKAESDEDCLVRFEITDTGIGIEPEKCGNLFKAFSQADGSITRQFGGTGLGLAISKQLVELMNGEIGVESKLGRGSTFWFAVRFVKASPVEKTASKNENIELRPKTSPFGRNDIETTGTSENKTNQIVKPKILVADDNAVNRKVALLMLNSLGYHADTAGSGMEVLEALRREHYDLILMDVQMPEMDGLEATRHIRNDRNRSESPYIIAMTANAMRGDRELCLEAGMDDYLSKPIRKNVLQTAIEKVLEKKYGNHLVEI